LIHKRLALSIALFVIQARTAERFTLTVENVMRGPELVGYEPAHVRWSFDSRRLYFEWKRHFDRPEAPPDTWSVNRDGSNLRKLTTEERSLAPPATGDTSRDLRLSVYTREGDLYLYNNTTGETRRLSRTAEAETNPHFLPDGRRIYFTRGGNLYVMALDTGYLEQFTEIRAVGAQGSSSAPSAPVATPPVTGGGRGNPASSSQASGTSASQDYLKARQKDLFETVRQRAALHDQDEARRKQESPRKPFQLQSRQTVNALELSPDEKYVTATVLEPGSARRTAVPNWITDTAYVEDLNARANVGDSQARVRLAVIETASGEVKWVDPEPEREVRLGQPVWSADGSHAFLQSRAADNKDTWILALDPATAKTRVIAREHDDAWVKYPGPTGPPAPGWMKNGREVYFVSERTGFDQLYAAPWEGGEPRALTSGRWEVLGLRQSPDRSHFYINANKENPYENHLYEMSGEGGPLTRLTVRPGMHTATISPDGRWIADIFSHTNQPPDIFVQENRVAAEPKRVTTSPAPEFSSYPWLDASIVTFRARDGVQVPARLFKPKSARKGGPGVVFVHGSGYLQNVDRWWSSHYYREYLFDHILMERGFTVIDVDYRGSAGYGRDWRTAIYQHMGGKDLDDIVDAARYLAAEHGVDAKKIGVYGGSYGGFITLMAMFTQPDVFAAGAALRPVSDWALYNHEYTSNILNIPQADPEAYRRSSPIYFAEGLKGALLICHGMVDTNVEFTDTVRLVQRLIELKKENWQLAVYPVEDHTFVEASSWSDEYKRILALFEKNLK
jgi:dipeptidyl aminopeptidase/acylaminoacyl peptidase